MVSKITLHCYFFVFYRRITIFFRYQKNRTKVLKRTVQAMVIDKNTKRQRQFDRVALFVQSLITCNRLRNFVVMLFPNIVDQNSEGPSYGQMTSIIINSIKIIYFECTPRYSS